VVALSVEPKMKWLVIGAFLLAAVWRIRRALPRRLSGRSIGTRRAGGPPTATHSRAKTANGASSEVVLGHITRLDATPQNNADQPVFSAADVIGRTEPDGSVTVIALEGIDDVSEKRRRLRLTRTIDMYSPTLGDVDRCGVAFARLAGCTNPVQLTRPVVFNSSRRVFLPSNRITAEVRIGYADKVGKEAASLFSVGRTSTSCEKNRIASFQLSASNRLLRKVNYSRRIFTRGAICDPGIANSHLAASST
jgi:hypothetical protein